MSRTIRRTRDEDGEVKEALSGAFKSAFTNGNIKRSGYVAVPTALVTVVATVLFQSYLLPGQSASREESRVAAVEARVFSHESLAGHPGITDRLIRQETRLEEYQLRQAETVRRIEERLLRIEDKVDRLLRRDP